MNFRPQPQRDRPELNLVAFIDVLLVILIFMMASATFSRLGALRIKLPDAAADTTSSHRCTVPVAVRADGHLTVAGRFVDGDAGILAQALVDAARSDADCRIDVHADALATHQSVVRVMEAARLAGLSALAFSTQSELAK